MSDFEKTKTHFDQSQTSPQIMYERLRDDGLSNNRRTTETANK